MTRRFSNLRSGCAGLTLLELLVVILLASVLAALLLPTVMATREAGRSVACQANLRGIGVAAHAYAQDRDGYLPSAAGAGLSDAWWYVLNQVDKFSDFNRRMVCKSDPNPTPLNFTVNKEKLELKCSYKYSQRLGRQASNGEWLSPQYRLVFISNPSVVPMVVEWHDPDGDPGSALLTFSPGQGSKMVGQHSGGRFSNILFVDGHVGRIAEAPPGGNVPGKWQWDPIY